MIVVKKNGQIVRADGKDLREVVSLQRVDFPEAGNVNVIYIATDENKVYRWDETEEDYIPVGSNGETYVAGNGIIIEDDAISIDDEVVATKEDLANYRTSSEQDVIDAGKASTETTDDLQTQIDNLKSRGRFLSGWSCTTGLPTTEPTTQLPYVYRAGDYFIVESVGATNYIPTGTQYTGDASTATSTLDIAVGDEFLFDGSLWLFISNTTKTITIANVNGLQATLDAKANASELQNYVDLSSAQTITGVKTFSGSAILPGAAYATDLGSNSKYFKDSYSYNVYVSALRKFSANPDIKVFAKLNMQSYQITDGTNEITVAEIDKKSTVRTITTATYNGGISSNELTEFTQPMTSLTIASLAVATGDNTPTFAIHFKLAEGGTVSFTPTIKWDCGNPVFEAGVDYIVVITKVGSLYFGALGEHY